MIRRNERYCFVIVTAFEVPALKVSYFLKPCFLNEIVILIDYLDVVNIYRKPVFLICRTTLILYAVLF